MSQPGVSQPPAAPGATVVRNKRGRQTALDMVRSIGLILVVIFVLLMVTPARQLIFPSSNSGGDHPRVTDGQQLTEWRDLTGHAALLPAIPAGWRMNAATMTGDSRPKATLHIGWQTAANGYVGVQQGYPGVRRLLAADALVAARPEGSVQIAGQPWSAYRDNEGDLAYARSLPDGRTIVVAGSGGVSDLQALVTSLHPVG